MERIIVWFKNFGELIKETFHHWTEIDPFNNSSIIAYYTIFSLPGLLVIIINITGFFFDKQDITVQITDQIGAIMGTDTATDIASIIGKASEAKATFLSTVFGVSTLLFGATGVFYELQQILNKIWKVKPKPSTSHKILVLIRDRLFSFGLILVVGFLLLVSLVLSTGLSVLSNWVATHWHASLNFLFRFLDITISVGFITLLFAAMFKFLPDVKIKWRDVWAGAFLTAVLFVIAKFALGFYFGKSNPASSYGAAGSIILIMLWISYTGLILLFGAVFTHIYILKYGIKPEPSEAAVSTGKDVLEKIGA